MTLEAKARRILECDELRREGPPFGSWHIELSVLSCTTAPELARAYLALLEEHARVREALEWYAYSDDYGDDAGARARDALKEGE